MLAFAGINYVLLENSATLFDAEKQLLTTLGAWLAIKTVGSYQNWGDPRLGRATYYRFLIGTLLNIVFGIVLGFIFFKIFRGI